MMIGNSVKCLPDRLQRSRCRRNRRVPSRGSIAFPTDWRPRTPKSRGPPRRAHRNAEAGRSRIGTSTTIGKAPKVRSRTPALFGPHRPTTLRKFGTSDELERLVSVYSRMATSESPTLRENSTLTCAQGWRTSVSLIMKGDEQRAAGEQQRHHRARLQPVQTIALIEAGIDHRDRGAEQQHAAPVGVASAGRG